jgi:hypothetical protein
LRIVPALVGGAGQRVHVVAAAGWQITRGADNIGSYNKTPNSYRKWCKTCGGHVMTEHPAWD